MKFKYFIKFISTTFKKNVNKNIVFTNIFALSNHSNSLEYANKQTNGRTTIFYMTVFPQQYVIQLKIVT